MSKIYIDGLGLVEGHFSGIGQYILGVLKGLDELIEQKRYNGEELPEVTVIIPYDCVKRFESFGLKHIGYKRLPLPFRYVAALWHRGRMFPLDLWCGKGTYLFTRFVDMPLLFSKSAVIIYDISFELYREYSDEKNAIFLSKGTKDSINRASRVITISQNARNEIVDFYKIPEKKVVVATPAVDQSLFYKRSKNEIEAVKKKYGISGDYIIALSNLEPRKNLDGLVDAYCKLPRETTDKVGLLLVGVNGWKVEKLFEKIIERVGEGFNIMRPSKYVKDEDKPAIISGAKILVYPSHYEGFGIPPLESLACGTPVITANNSSLPEVVSGVGRMIDSNNTDALSSAIATELKNLPEIEKKVSQKGPERARTFSWENSAHIIWDTLIEVEK